MIRIETNCIQCRHARIAHKYQNKDVEDGLIFVLAADDDQLFKTLRLLYMAFVLV